MLKSPLAMLPQQKSDELVTVIQSCRRLFVEAGLFSLGINLLYLAAPLYMLQIYDRVISSASHTTLIMLTIVVLMAFIALAGLDVVRSRILTRASVRLDRKLGGRVLAATIDTAAKGSPLGAQPLRDFDNFRQFLTGTGIRAIFDAPWAPIYFAVIFMLHPALGIFALLAGVALIGMAVLNERLVRAPLAESNDAAARNYRFTEMSLRNWEAVRAMGIFPGLLQRWSRDRNKVIERQVAASDRAAATQSLIRFLRLAVQSIILGIGAWLVIERQITVGAMFAASILLGRALQPIELMVGNWRNFYSARSAYDRLKTLLAANPESESKVQLPRPSGRIVIENLSYGIRGAQRQILYNINIAIEPGEVVAIIGPSGAGKSTLARQIVAVLSPVAGAVRLDGADVSKWPHDRLGEYVGYLPQDIELFADTVANNICRFRDSDDSAIIAAAQLAGVHNLILALPNGYDTQVGDGGAFLSGGLRQRIALARAVYGNPSLVVLDEPNSNLDQEGDQALAECITQLKSRRITVVVIAHRSSTLGVVDKILVMKEGAAVLYGTRADVIPKLARPASVKVLPTTGGGATATGGAA
jgi:ATP-binding cassette subfamily C protein